MFFAVTRYIVEMQNKKLSSFFQRIEYYASCIYSNQHFEGQDYLKLKPVIRLATTNHNVFPSNIQCISYHRNCEEEMKRSFYQISCMYLLNFQNFINAGINSKLLRTIGYIY